MSLAPKSRAIGPRSSIAARIPSIIFWSFSTALTGSGVFFSLRPSMPDTVSALAIALVTTSALTFGAFNLFHYAGAQAGKTEKPGAGLASHVDIDVKPRFRELALAAGLAVILLSSWFSFSSMVYMRFGPELQRAMNDEVQAPLIAPIRDLEASFAKIEIDARRLADVAGARSAVEARVGGQCVDSRPGNGPIAALIASHATATAAIAADAATLRQQAGQALRAIRGASEQAAVDGAYQIAQGVLSDPARLSILASAEALEAGYNGGGFVQDGRQILCPRGAPTMVPVLDTLLDSARANVALPVSPPVFRQASLVDSAMWQFRSALSFGANRIPDVGGWYLLLFGLVALALDMSGAATAHLAGRLRGGNLTADEIGQLETTEAIMENFIWDTPESYRRNGSGNVVEAFFNSVLVIPTEEDSRETAEIISALRRFASAYNLRADVTRTARLLADLPDQMRYLQRRMRRRGFDGELIDIYTASLEDWELIERHRRELRKIFGRAARIETQRFDLAPQPDNVMSLHAHG
ncbi:hypothetical protein [Roseinatronobacter monicus]|uniref:Uncharacterized protein n=1 Tax=Roseinatronobacter monicus TaxID=393481 RepID=A0A543K4D5_9RHOB|nr:hypothetical protein [Roseinatronobacter monicus]TQM89943.1 hypothetical protein BD293_4261 [Roseinatronobacter monicus]